MPKKADEIVLSKKKAKSLGYEDSPTNDLENWVFEVVPEIFREYGIEETSLYVKTLPIDERRYRDENGEGVMDISYNKPYKTAYLNIHPMAQELWEEENISILAQTITHEVAHILTNALGEAALNRHVTRKEINEHVEHLTESIAQMGRKLLRLNGAKVFKSVSDN